MSICSLTKIRSRWLAVLGLTVAVLFGGGLVAYFLTAWPMIATDAAFFQHVGWYIIEGGVPYVDVWDVNPPIPFAITAVLALLSGGDMLVLHGLSVLLTELVAAASVLLVGWVAYRVTEDDAAAVSAGLTMFVVPELFALPLLGVRAQFYSLFFGVLALALALSDRPFLAGVAAALSAGSWQSGTAFAPLVVGIAYQRNGGKDALSAIAGAAVVTGAVVLAFALAGALVPMVVQTVVAPLVAGSSYTLAQRIYLILIVFGYGAVLLPVALYGWARAARDFRTHWWLPAGGAIFAFQVLIIDMDGSTDALLWVTFVALGVAVAVKRMPSRRSDATNSRERDARRARRYRWIAVVVVALIVVSGFGWNVGSPPPKSTLEAMEQEADPGEPTPITVTRDDADVPSIRTIYWEKRTPETCHYRLSWNELRWISRTDSRLDARECGGWLN
ncbi:DolP-mannose mannosyltransferase [Halosolutus gelatinilyticus]|uniref:DolP-mannose mannosyltransferase n=1 Tax=Halosolutus gelatinilyticus TaxID=2931975 RepID=UPI001FF2D3EB|nr:DolP-mannose mannosyltransferase [Halosolutus gelatinilyticus]